MTFNTSASNARTFIYLQILKTIPWNKITAKIVGIEINHVPEGREAREFMVKQGYIFYRLIRIDYIFYQPDFKDELNL